MFKIIYLLIFLISSDSLSSCSKTGETENEIDNENIFVDSTKSCFGNTEEQAPLTDIQPKIYYIKTGGNSNNLHPSPSYVFKLNYTDEEFQSANIDAELPSKFITHGYDSSWNESSNDWIQDILNTLAESPITKYNTFVLSWPNSFIPQSDGQIVGYSLVAGTTRTIGSYLGEFIVRYKRNLNRINLNTIHLIGHSLGSHVMGFAGQRVLEDLNEKVGKLTALDPAGPCFTLAREQERINRNCAQFVEAIHTNAGLLGIPINVGHRDIWLNNGFDQPGCLLFDVSCSHARSHDIYSDNTATGGSHDCQVVAYQCDSHSQFDSGACGDCQSNESRCHLVTLPQVADLDEYSSQALDELSVTPNEVNNATNDHTKNNKYFIKTSDGNGKYKLCLQHYQIVADSNVCISKISLSYDDNTQSKHNVDVSHNNGTSYTGLLTFDGLAKKFTNASAKISSLISTNAEIKLKVQFMSHYSADKRAELSSSFCSKSDLGTVNIGQEVKLEQC